MTPIHNSPQDKNNKKKKSASKSAFSQRILIGLAFCSTGLLLALLAFALYPGGNALAQRPRQDQATPAHSPSRSTAKAGDPDPTHDRDRKSTRLNSSHLVI